MDPGQIKKVLLNLILNAEEAGADYEVSLESLSQWELAWRKFRNHRLALVGATILAIFAAAIALSTYRFMKTKRRVEAERREAGKGGQR